MAGPGPAPQPAPVVVRLPRALPGGGAGGGGDGSWTGTVACLGKSSLRRRGAAPGRLHHRPVAGLPPQKRHPGSGRPPRPGRLLRRVAGLRSLAVADGLMHHETNGVSTVEGKPRPGRNRTGGNHPGGNWPGRNQMDVCRVWLVADFWQERQDSNPRPLVLETSALARLSYAPAWYPWRDSNPRRAT